MAADLDDRRGYFRNPRVGLEGDVGYPWVQTVTESSSRKYIQDDGTKDEVSDSGEDIVFPDDDAEVMQFHPSQESDEEVDEAMQAAVAAKEAQAEAEDRVRRLAIREASARRRMEEDMIMEEYVEAGLGFKEVERLLRARFSKRTINTHTTYYARLPSVNSRVLPSCIMNVGF